MILVLKVKEASTTLAEEEHRVELPLHTTTLTTALEAGVTWAGNEVVTMTGIVEGEGMIEGMIEAMRGGMTIEVQEEPGTQETEDAGGVDLHHRVGGMITIQGVCYCSLYTSTAQLTRYADP